MTKDDLDQIDQLLRRRLKEEIDPLHERLDALSGRISGVENNLVRVEKSLSGHISREVTDLAELIRDSVFPKLVKDDEQIHELQEAVGLKPPKH